MRHKLDEELKPCPACPDGYVWTSNGPTGAACKTCGGYAVVKLNGERCDAAKREVPPREYEEDGK